MLQENKKSVVSCVKCKDYKSVNTQAALRNAVDLIGGISKFVRPKSRVLLKPNLLMAIEPESGVITHPEVIRATIRLLKEVDAKIYIGDSPSVWGKSQELKEVYRRSGIAALAECEGVELVEFTAKGLKNDLLLTSFLNNVDCVISISKLKTHGLMTLTAAVKNLFGLIPGLYKSELHKKHFKIDDFAGRLVDIYELVKPCLNIVDAVDAMEGDGPGTGGDLRHVGLLLAGNDAIAIDSILARLIGVDPEDIPTIRQARKRNLGNSDLESITLRGESLNDVIIPDFKLPQPSIVQKIPRGLFSFLTGLIKYYPVINSKVCVKCGKCEIACPEKIIDIKRKHKIDYSNCIKCFCCLEVCPERAIAIKKSLVAKILGLRG
ncbi:MAG TPA: DUF362 domain-containing protein [Candidatus Omnitrophica bacterium]|nr:DUF362 domain-containing protein [Candidatus Omnitrophota bacterium]